MNLSLLSDEEKEHDHSEWYEPKLAHYNEFYSGVEFWLHADAVDEQPVQAADVITPHDNVSQNAEQAVSNASSRGSKASSALSEARVQRAMLIAQSQLMDEQIELDMEEARIKAKKEKLKLQTKIAKTEAKIKVPLESQNEDAEISNLAFSSRTSTEYIIPTTEKRVQARQRVYSDQLSTIQRPTPSRVKLEVQSAKENPRSIIQSIDENPLIGVLKRQNEITELLVKQHALSQLPQREIPVFHGNPLYFISFIKAFEQTIEGKTDNMQQRLYYLEQYTSGEPRNLVRSCFHMPPDKGYKEAKEQLEWHYGNKIKITSAFMDKAVKWPAIRAEDAAGLRSYAIFLKSCHNTMQDMGYVVDLETPSNLKIIVSKLPFKLRDKWRTVVCNIYDKHNQRATFKDLLAFIDKQSGTMLGPVFGEIQSSINKSQEIKMQNKVVLKSNSRGSSFATAVSPVIMSECTSLQYQTNDKAPCTVYSSSAFTKPCMLCNKSHSLETCEMFKAKLNKEKVEFLKANGMCFGCLQKGHMSKSCQKRMSCSVCKQSHPTILHIQKKEKQNNQSDKDRTDVNAVVSLVTGGYTGAGMKECALAIVPVKVKLEKGTKCVKTYAFLDPGSSATFCTEELARKSQ